MPRDIEITTWIEAAHFREWRNLLSRGNDQLQMGKSSNKCDHVKAKKMNSTQSRRPRVQPRVAAETRTGTLYKLHRQRAPWNPFLSDQLRVPAYLSEFFTPIGQENCDKAGSGRSINCPCNAIFTPYLKEFLCNGSSYKNKANARLLH